MLQLGLFMFSPDQGGDLFRFARDFVETLPDDCGVFMAGLSAPPEPFVPAELHFTPAFALAVVGLGDEQEHARLIEPIKQALDPIVELITPIPYVGLQQMFDASAPWGMHNYEKAVYLAELSDGAIDAILAHQAKKASPLSFVPIFPLGGAYRRADNNATAFGGSRDTRYVVNISATAMTPDDYESERAWSRRVLVSISRARVRCRELCELHDRVRRGPCQECLWPQIRPAPADQVRLRPWQCLPSERQHPTRLEQSEKPIRVSPYAGPTAPIQLKGPSS